MVAALAKGERPDHAFRVGVAAGCAAVMSPGTELCREEDVRRLLDDVRVSEVAQAVS
jgi:6-phosphofructokinase 2